MAINQQDVVIAVKDAIIAAIDNTDISVYDSASIQGPTLPFIVFTIINDLPIHYFDDDDVEVDIQIDFYGKMEAGITAIRTLNDDLVTTLNRASITIDGADNGNIICVKRANFNQQFITSAGRTARDRARITTQWKLRASNTVV